MSSNAQPFCPNCFSEKTDGNPVCIKCGYDDRAYRSPAVLPPGTVLNDQYVVGRVLGSPGGFGITYLCWDRRLTTRVAIKEFIPRENAVRDRDGCCVVAHSEKDMDSFAYGLKAFLSEARTVAGFNHPNIVRVRTYFEQHRTGYMVMDYYEGISLADYVKQQGGRLPEKTAFGIMGFVLDALRYVHQQGYLHRDVKPQNIYMTSQGQVILLDFGAARYSIGMHSKTLSVVVTPGYSPFEQYRSTGQQGQWTDVYSCGATLYYLLTGVAPVDVQDRMEEDGLEPPERLVSGLSPLVSAGIMRALRVKAEERPQSIDELWRMLGGHPVPDPPPEPSKPAPNPARVGPGTRKAMWWENRKMQLGLVLVVLGLVYWNLPGKGELIVRTEPGDAEIYIGGKASGRGEVRLSGLSPGELEVKASRSGYGEDRKQVAVRSGGRTEVMLRLPLLTGSLSVKTEPSGAEVVINGQSRGRTPLELMNMSPGSLKVRVSREGYESREETVSVVGGESRQVEWRLMRSVGSLRVETDPPGAEIQVNGVVKGKSPLDMSDLKPGPVKVRANMGGKGYGVREETVGIEAGRETQLKWKLDVLMGSLRVRVKPVEASIYVDEELKGTGGIEVGRVATGSVRVKGVYEGYMPQEKTVDVVSGKETAVDLVLSKVGETWTDPVTGMEFVWVPGGCYQMGCGWTSDCRSDESPVHEVCVDGFWLGKTEVTQGQWVKVMGSNPSNFEMGRNYPVERVSWEDAKEYIRKLNGLGSSKFRLPSEAEWEYAARSGGKAEKYSGANDVDAVAWHKSNSGKSTHPVKTKKANGLGIYDMSGNVWEWCEDVYIFDIYSRSPKKNPIYTSGGTDRVVRGGSWFIEPVRVRCADRFYLDPASRNHALGFRLLRIP